MEAHFPHCFLLAVGVAGGLQGLRTGTLGEQGRVRYKGFKNLEVEGGQLLEDHFASGLEVLLGKGASQILVLESWEGVKGWNSGWSVRQTFYH